MEFASKGHSHLDPTISTITLSVPPLDEDGLSKLDLWLRKTLWESILPGAETDGVKFEVHRLKGRISTRQGQVKLIQGVRDVFEVLDSSESSTRSTGKAEAFVGKLVVIGRGLQYASFERSLRQSLE